jgi:hypothetical protein
LWYVGPPRFTSGFSSINNFRMPLLVYSYFLKQENIVTVLVVLNIKCSSCPFSVEFLFKESPVSRI